MYSESGAKNSCSEMTTFEEMKLGNEAVTSANSPKMGMILFTKFGVSDTKTNLGFETVVRLSMAFLMHCTAACKPLTDLKYGCTLLS